MQRSSLPREPVPVVVPTPSKDTRLLRSITFSGTMPHGVCRVSPCGGSAVGCGETCRCRSVRVHPCCGKTCASGEPCVPLFVGTLALTTMEQDLRQRFESSGTVETIWSMTDRETGRARGCGLVEMSDSPEAPDAIAGLNGTLWASRGLMVHEATPREPRREPRRPHW